MEVQNITEQWLQQQQFQIHKGLTIEGTFLKDLTTLLDDRGDVIELWSTAWPEYQEGKVIPTLHAYQSATDPGVVKCWHLHGTHTDQFTVTRGKLQVCLVDIREGSPTFGHANSVILGVQKPRYLKIPPGIMHGWKALGTTESIVVNFQSHPYDAADEFKFTWDCVLPEMWGPKNG
ncbi:MAG TPA: dTDP-4-dehydrorhamnose 3,5-epimerase family protein [Vitreimonas sp.]|nr:dTDP-4-dehydrorhamnose 3,5-epimerase family protein [Vitreimonas sp.]